MSADVGELLRTLPQSVSTFRVSGASFASLSSVETAPGAVALADAPHWSEAQVFNQSALLLVVAGVQDPGNLGTMIRTAEAFGFSGAILTRGTVSPWNAKAFRASAGTTLRLPILRNFSPAQTVQMLHEHQVKLYGAVVREGRAPADIDTRGTIAVAVGAEASGLPAELERASEHLSIPMAAKVDSLNAAAATAIILYELARQRVRTGRTN